MFEIYIVFKILFYLNNILNIKVDFKILNNIYKIHLYIS